MFKKLQDFFLQQPKRWFYFTDQLLAAILSNQCDSFRRAGEGSLVAFDASVPHLHGDETVLDDLWFRGAAAMIEESPKMHLGDIVMTEMLQICGSFIYFHHVKASKT